MKTRSGLIALAFLLGAGVLALRLWVSQPAAAQNSLTLGLDSIVTGLSLPVSVTHAGDGSNRLFILEQGGRVRIFQNGSLLGTPFLDIQSRVTSGGEKGLLGIAFHPDYRNNRRFFLNYTQQPAHAENDHRGISNLALELECRTDHRTRSAGDQSAL